MSMIYKHEKTNTSIVTGKVKSIADDCSSLVLTTAEYDKQSKSNKVQDVEIKSSIPFEGFSVGQNASIVGYPIPDMADPNKKVIQSIYASNKSESFDYGTLCVVNGEVMFASYNDEKDENGNPKMTAEYTDESGNVKPSHPKKPHFDISIKVREDMGEGAEPRYVLHTMVCYPYNDDMKSIERYQKLFANFDKTENPVYATVVTQPGQVTSKTKQVGDKEYVNYYCRHMGIRKLDAEFIKDRERQAEQPAMAQEAAAPAPAPAAPAAAPAQASPTEVADDESYFLD